MSIIIKDGTGSGRSAHVNRINRLSVASISDSSEHRVSSEDGLSFFANSADTANTLTITATGGPILYLRNDSATRIIVISKILSSAAAAGGVMVWKKNVTLGSIGNNNVHVPVNLNFSSGAVADALCHTWDQVGDGMTGLTSGTIIKTFITGAGFTVHPIDDAVVLGNGDSITVEYSHASGTEFECGIRFFYEAEDVI